VAGVVVVLFVTQSKIVPADLLATGGSRLHVCRSEAYLRDLLADPGVREAAGVPDIFAMVANTKKWASASRT
jgi:hypothetical protein